MLSTRAVGSFLIRPHESFKDQLFLSFKHSDDNNTENIRHAVIRRDHVSDNHYVYQCGKVGPFTLLIELLKNITTLVSCGLIFEKIPIEKKEVFSFDLNEKLWSNLSPQLLTLLECYYIDDFFLSSKYRTHNKLHHSYDNINRNDSIETTITG